MNARDNRAQAQARAIRPAALLVRLLLVSALLALAAMPMPALLAPTLGFLAIVIGLALADWRISRADTQPQVERVFPDRMVRKRRAAVLYRVSRARRPASVTILDEMPEELGGDLAVEGIRIDPDRRSEVSREIVPTRRGTFEMGPIYVAWKSRLGLFQFRAAAPAGGNAVVFPPASAAPPRAGLTHRSLREELGMRPRTARGEGTEFESMREYVAGDDPRHVDWHASARRGRLIVRQYQTERRHTVMIAVDTGRLMAARVESASKLDHALDCAIALARACGEYGDRVGFIAFDRELRAMLRPRSGPGGVGALIDASTGLTHFSFEPDYRVMVETLARYQKKRALVVVLTDFVEGSASRELESYLGVLARRHCVLLVALRDRLLAQLDVRAPEITRERLYRRLALQDLAVEREAALARIARFGAQTLDLDPARVTAPVLNRYLAIRQAALL